MDVVTAVAVTILVVDIVGLAIFVGVWRWQHTHR